MREKIKNVMKTVFEMPEIPEDISVGNCDKWDSLHHLSLVLELESLFNISLKLNEVSKMKDLETIEAIIKSKTGQ
jgi:acyl carrier protein